MTKTKFKELLNMNDDQIKELIQAVENNELTTDQLEEVNQVLMDIAEERLLEDVSTYDYLEGIETDLFDLVSQKLL